MPEKITIPYTKINPKHFRYFEIGPAPLCQCSHTKLEHRLDKTCRKCLCIRWQEQPAEQDEKEDSHDDLGN